MTDVTQQEFDERNRLMQELLDEHGIELVATELNWGYPRYGGDYFVANVEPWVQRQSNINTEKELVRLLKEIKSDMKTVEDKNRIETILDPLSVQLNK